MDGMTITISAFFFSMFTSVLSGYFLRKDSSSLAQFFCFAVMVFCFGVNSAVLLFKLMLGGV
jgi:hypothetical protein